MEWGYILLGVAGLGHVGHRYRASELHTGHSLRFGSKAGEEGEVVEGERLEVIAFEGDGNGNVGSSGVSRSITSAIAVCLSIAG